MNYLTNFLWKETHCSAPTIFMTIYQWMEIIFKFNEKRGRRHDEAKIVYSSMTLLIKEFFSSLPLYNKHVFRLVWSVLSIRLGSVHYRIGTLYHTAGLDTIFVQIYMDALPGVPARYRSALGFWNIEFEKSSLMN